LIQFWLAPSSAGKTDLRLWEFRVTRRWFQPRTRHGRDEKKFREEDVCSQMKFGNKGKGRRRRPAVDGWSDPFLTAAIFRGLILRPAQDDGIVVHQVSPRE
jgi:hypothetical protein